MVFIDLHKEIQIEIQTHNTKMFYKFCWWKILLYVQTKNIWDRFNDFCTMWSITKQKIIGFSLQRIKKFSFNKTLCIGNLTFPWVDLWLSYCLKIILQYFVRGTLGSFVFHLANKLNRTSKPFTCWLLLIADRQQLRTYRPHDQKKMCVKTLKPNHCDDIYSWVMWNETWNLWLLVSYMLSGLFILGYLQFTIYIWLHWFGVCIWVWAYESIAPSPNAFVS